MKIQIILLFSLLVLTSCGNSADKKKLEKEYEIQFNKEYDEFLTSDRWKQFGQNYKKLCDVTKMIANTDSIAVDDSSNVDFNLCFISPSVEVAEIENLRKINESIKNGSRKKTKTKMKLFSEYDNLSKDINAILVGANFYLNTDTSRTVAGEYEMHLASKAGNKAKFIESVSMIDNSMENTYYRFCKARISMDELNNCKYIVVIKTMSMVNGSMISSAGMTGVFTGGYIKGLIYLYNLETNKIQKVVEVEAGNTDELQIDKSKGTSKQMEDDLKRNYKNVLTEELKKNFNVNGTVPLISF